MNTQLHRYLFVAAFAIACRAEAAEVGIPIYDEDAARVAAAMARLAPPLSAVGTHSAAMDRAAWAAQPPRCPCPSDSAKPVSSTMRIATPDSRSVLQVWSAP
jgi:hypothetical protein